MRTLLSAPCLLISGIVRRIVIADAICRWKHLGLVLLFHFLENTMTHPSFSRGNSHSERPEELDLSRQSIMTKSSSVFLKEVTYAPLWCPPNSESRKRLFHTNIVVQKSLCCDGKKAHNVVRRTDASQE
jgi:hypothetical protein